MHRIKCICHASRVLRQHHPNPVWSPQLLHSLPGSSFWWKPHQTYPRVAFREHWKTGKISRAVSIQRACCWGFALIMQICLIFPGGSAAGGLPQHGQPVHVWNLHRNEKPSLPGSSVWNSGHAEGAEVKRRNKRKVHTNWSHTYFSLTFCFPSPESCSWGSRAKSLTNLRIRTPTWREDLRRKDLDFPMKLTSKRSLNDDDKLLQPAYFLYCLKEKERQVFVFSSFH